MRFELLPLLGIMLDLYKKPTGFDRFKEYLALLVNEGATDIELPITGYNPMGKEHVLQKLEELKQLNAEGIMENSIQGINERLNNDADYAASKACFKIGMVVADDLMGGWTNRFSTDYQSKFSSKALVKRHFCTPLFWTSEVYDGALIGKRTKDYVYRTIYQVKNGHQTPLEEHILQESFVNRQTDAGSGGCSSEEVAPFRTYYEEYKQSSDYPTIFSFLYGEEAAQEFGYTTTCKGEPYLGFKIAHYLTERGI